MSADVLNINQDKTVLVDKRCPETVELPMFTPGIRGERIVYQCERKAEHGSGMPKGHVSRMHRYEGPIIWSTEEKP